MGEECEKKMISPSLLVTRKEDSLGVAAAADDDGDYIGQTVARYQ